jgi:hypothetical protein
VSDAMNLDFLFFLRLVRDFALQMRFIAYNFVSRFDFGYCTSSGGLECFYSKKILK